MQLDLDTASFKRLTELGKQFPKAGSRALNKLAGSAKSFISSEIRGTYNIKKSELDPTLIMKISTPNSLESRVRALRTKRFNLIRFGARQGKTGVTVQIKRGERQIRVGAFIANQGRTVFKRIGKTRLPIKALVAPFSMTELFGSRHMRAKVEEFIKVRFPEVLKQELKYFFSKTSA